MTTVCVDLIGRLGNNLWQIAVCVGYAEKHGVEFFIPSWEYASCFRTNFTKESRGSTNYGEKTWAYEELPFIPDVKLFGYFQSYKYFDHCEGKIRELFQFNDEIVNKINNKYSLPNNNCSIHVRRGDYIGNGLHEVCHLEYYLEAVEEMKSRTEIDKFIVFSDDIAWCKSQFVGPEFLFIEDNSNIEDMYLMSMCANNIICNSSFSWWASWLNANPNKIVIAPEKWYNDESKNTNDMLPEKWIKIKIK